MFLKILGFLGGIFSSIFQKAGETVGEEVGKKVTEIHPAPKTKRVFRIVVCVCVLLCGIGWFLYRGFHFKWSLNDGVLTLEAGFLTNGEMPDYHFVKPDFRMGNANHSAVMISDFPWFYRREEITRVILKDGITSISSGAFADCVNLEEAYLPDSIIAIGDYAFHDCYTLTYITIPSSIADIGKYAFNQCRGLIEVSCRYNGKSNSKGIIEYGAFWNCDSLQYMEIPYNMVKMGPFAFSYCSSLTEIYIPNGITKIETGTFQGCSNLKEISIEGVREIGWGAFFDCFNLTKITMPDSITHIHFSAFDGCANLTSVSIPADAEIADDAFPEWTEVTRRG